jgi:predicted metal-dependent phosphoesterase TrpH
MILMKYIDLHVHSTISDGTLSPTEVVAYAKKKNLCAIALTDHDTIEGLQEAQIAGKEYGIEVIPGVELAAEYKDREIHILGLFIDPDNTCFKQKLFHLQTARMDRNKKMLTKFQNIGIHITMDDLEQAADKDVITRAHFARALFQKGYVKDLKQAFDRYLSPGMPGYIQREIFSPKECIEMIHHAGGISVLAHPTLYHLSINELDLLIKNLKENGLGGIEAIYSLYSNDQEDHMRTLAHRYNLAITGGSDFHGSNKKHIDLGIGRGNLKIEYDVLQSLKTKRDQIHKKE